MVRVELFVRARFLEPERVEVRDEMPAHAVHVDELLDRDDLVLRLDGTFHRAAVGRPARGLVGNAEAREDVVVEAVAAEQQIVDLGQELAALRALDDAVVVGARERDGLAHADLGEGLRIGTFVLGRVRDRTDTDDHALAGHQPRNGMQGADRARVRQRNRGAREVVDGELVRAAPGG